MSSPYTVHMTRHALFGCENKQLIIHSKGEKQNFHNLFTRKLWTETVSEDLATWHVLCFGLKGLSFAPWIINLVSTCLIK